MQIHYFQSRDDAKTSPFTSTERKPEKLYQKPQTFKKGVSFLRFWVLTHLSESADFGEVLQANEVREKQKASFHSNEHPANHPGAKE